MISLLAALAALSAQGTDAAEAYRACAEVESRRARLRCFDEAAAADSVLLARAEAAATATARAEAAEEAAAAERRAQSETGTGVPLVNRSPNTTNENLAMAQSRAAEAERRAMEAEAALARAEERAGEAESRVGPAREAFDDQVDALGFGADRTLIVRLDDGSVWRQIRDDESLDEDELSRIQRAYVRPGALGSWRMTLEPLGRTIKVRPRAVDPRAN